MEVLREFHRLTGLKINYSRSFKVKNDGSFEDRPLYRINCNNKELEVLLQLFPNNEIYNHIRCRYSGKLLIFYAIRENYLKISVCPSNFIINEIVCYGVEINNGILTNSTYDCIQFSNENIEINVPKFLQPYIVSKYSVLRRHDLQHYFLVPSCTPKRILSRIFDIPEYQEWLKNQNGTPFWYQKCPESETIYFKDDTLEMF